MVKKEPVDLTLQTVFSLVPYLNLYAFYRVQKLRRYILISIAISITVITIFVGVTLGMMSGVKTPEEGISIYEKNMGFLNSPLYYIPGYIGGALLNIYLIRRWSKKWNEKFQSENS